ncbi:MAG TPA: LLM class flavin-dependent oxidoreductase [Gaiellaceae bacterium]|jgi:5,10-methylenetetrahydromethanopterin reductase|nr:LLM class flavin-dependent oxidoreductase [Gaiellaceae bacterium]
MSGPASTHPSLGVGLFGTEPAARMVELALCAETCGFETAWMGDSQNIWREAYVTLGAAAPATSTLQLGTGVTNAVTRHPSVLASAWATLAELAPGRVAFAIGTGDSSLRTMGLAPPTVVELEQRILQLRRLLAGDEVVEDATGGRYRLHFAPDQHVPIYVAGASPRALRMAGRVADGVIACVGVDRRLVDSALAHVAAGAEETGRDPTSIRVVLWTAVAVEDDGDSARDLVRAFTASVVVPPLVGRLDPPEWSAIERIRERYQYSDHMRTDAEHRLLVPDELVSHFAVGGTPEDCRSQLREILTYPIDQLALVPFVPNGGDRGLLMQRLATEVLEGLV